MDFKKNWDDMQKKLQEAEDERDIQYQRSLKPGDETTPADTWGNKIKSTLGLPDSWQQTVAQEKYNAVQPKPIEAAVSPLISGPEQQGASLVAKGAQRLAPELEALVQQMRANPNMPLEVGGKINGQSFQKLRDLLGHVGPVIFKGGK